MLAAQLIRRLRWVAIVALVGALFAPLAFGRWAALAIHDTSSVVGAALTYGKTALDVATTTKLARALWIVPVTLAIAVLRQRGKPEGLRGVKWPYFILGFLAAAAFFTYAPTVLPAAAPLVAKLQPLAVLAARRLLVLALYLIGLSLSREALRTVGWRPLAQGVARWILVGAASLPLAGLAGS